jgi:hypothetical protein
MKQFMKPLYVSMLCVLIPLFAHQAVSSDPKDTNQKQRAASSIFDDIMQTLPAPMKAKVDSASANRKCERQAQPVKGQASGASRSTNQAAASRRDGAVNNLPDDVRGQVEKAVTDIDLMNQNRQVQFKEYEKKHPGAR